MNIVSYGQIPAFTTKDGSTIREIAAPRNAPLKHVSLAEARLKAGESTTEHYHKNVEEIYYILEGEAKIRAGKEEKAVKSGDAIVFPPQTRHKTWNTGKRELVFLCVCAPAYSDEDAVMTE